jgi:hypothetical protein
MEGDGQPYPEISIAPVHEVLTELKGNLIDQLPISVELDCDSFRLPRTTLRFIELREPGALGSGLVAIEVDGQVELTIGINRCRFLSSNLSPGLLAQTP